VVTGVMEIRISFWSVGGGRRGPLEEGRMEDGVEGADGMTDVDLSDKVFPNTKLKYALTLRHKV